MNKSLGVWLCVSVAFLLGCNQTEEGGLVRASGTVTFSDGTPVTGENATIVFLPERSNKPAKSAMGTLDAQGKYELMTNKPGDGIYPGSYKIVLKVWENYREQKLGVPKAYSEEQSTSLNATIGEARSDLDFVVER